MSNISNIDKHKVIGITGRKFSGKDTLGNFLVNDLGYQKIAYAEKLGIAILDKKKHKALLLSEPFTLDEADEIK